MHQGQMALPLMPGLKDEVALFAKQHRILDFRMLTFYMVLQLPFGHNDLVAQVTLFAGDNILHHLRHLRLALVLK
jgi:hypothetical protein